jgi:hypothetical protein
MADTPTLDEALTALKPFAAAAVRIERDVRLSNPEWCMQGDVARRAEITFADLARAHDLVLAFLEAEEDAA